MHLAGDSGVELQWGGAMGQALEVLEGHGFVSRTAGKYALTDEGWGVVQTHDEKTVDDWMESFGFCTCGRPQDVLALLVDALEWCGTPHLERGKDEWLRTLRETPGFELALYVIDAKELIEHGGGVGGGWLTAAGQAALSKYRPVRERFKRYESSEKP